MNRPSAQNSIRLSNSTLNNIKLIVSDLDGTLLNDEGNISNETQTLIKELMDSGIKFSFATARPHSAIINFAGLLDLRDPLISLDGALIRSYPSNQNIFESYVPARHVRTAIEYADQYLLKIALCHVEAIYYTEHNSAIPQMLDKFGSEFKEISSYDGYMNNVLEVVIAGERNDSVKYIKNRMNFPYSFGIESSYSKSHYHPGIYYTEIRKNGVSKATALDRLRKCMKIKINETAVLGDWYNDRELFETKAIKIAVANAVPEIKRMADYITRRTNNEGGVAEFLEMVLIARKGINVFK